MSSNLCDMSRNVPGMVPRNPSAARDGPIGRVEANGPSCKGSRAMSLNCEYLAATMIRSDIFACDEIWPGGTVQSFG